MSEQDKIEIAPQMIEAAKAVLYSSSRWLPARGQVDYNFVREMLVAGLNAMPSSRSLPPSEELKNLHEAIGFSLGQWQFVEAELGRLFVVLTKSQDQWAANSGFFAVDSFYSKMEMVNGAAQRALMMKR